MERRSLGSTGVELSRIILGCGNFGGIGSAPEHFGGGETEDEACALMDAAWTAGVDAFDTADAYGGGRSETWIGRWMRDRGRRPTLTTKVFHSVVGDPADRGLAPARVARQLDGSLARLGVERVDLYLLHQPDPDTPVELTLAAFDDAVRHGKALAVGASNVDVAWLEQAVDICRREGFAPISCVQNAYSLLDRTSEDVIVFCARNGIAFEAFGPLCGGWLTGKYRRGHAPPTGSRMTLRPAPYAHLDCEEVYAGLDAFEAAARDRGVDQAMLAFAWVLSAPDVSAAVVGPRTPEQLEPALTALELRLSRDDRDELASLFDS